jgi:hypothetical protein
MIKLKPAKTVSISIYFTLKPLKPKIRLSVQ